MKKIIFIALLCWTGTTINAQSSEEVQKERAGYEQPYHPEEDGDMRINQLLKQAKKDGYPAFLILSAKGEVLFTQKSEDLEDGKGYDPKKVKKFLQGRL